MKNFISTSLAGIFLLCSVLLNGQDVKVNPTFIGTGTYWGVSKPLRDLPALTKREFKKLERQCRRRELNEGLGHRSYPFAATALPKGEDPVWQKLNGTFKGTKSPIVNFSGETSPYYPPDCNGPAGPNHIMQTVNCVYAIYDKTGTLMAGPTAINLLFGSVPGSNRNDGDPIVLYDDQAGKWLVCEFSIPNSGPNYMMMAVSTTNDPTGTWYQYSFQVDAMPDYPKFGIWRDGYYMGDNNGSGKDIYVFERSQMLTGGTAQYVGFHNPNRPQSVDGFMCVPPVDNDGQFAPVGTPCNYIAFNDDALGGGTDQLWIYELSVNWTTPASSTFGRVQQIDVAPFSANFGPNWNNITQKGTSQKVDGIPQVIMHVPQYRNFGSYQTIVCCHTVNVDGNGHAGVRWYELRKTVGDWTLRQQSTYAPDADNRWMGSIMLNANNKIALGYSVSSTNTYPSIRYCGQSPSAYNAASGVMDIPEDTIQVGANSQTGINRWGDYSLMSVDPTDDETFWFTDEYIGNGGSRLTKIASFKFITGPAATTMPATNVGGVSATLNGTVNPQGIATTYHFEYGTTVFSMNDSTTSVDAGSSTTPMNVSADISGLNSNQKYYFRIVARNSGGAAFGSNLSFTTGIAPMLNVTPPNQSMTNSSGTTFFNVESNLAWTVLSDATWCTVTPSGSGNDTIHAACTENTTTGTRIANITVSGPGVSSQVVTVTQNGTPFLYLTPANRNVSNTPDTTHFTVSSNVSWTITSDSAWCTVTPSGSGNGTVHTQVFPNTTVNSRVAHITATGTGGLTETSTVTQAGAAPFLTVTPPNQNVTAPTGNTSFNVTSNISWTATSNASWCTVTPAGNGNGTIVANFLENPDAQIRTALIGVTAGSLSQNVTVTQARYGLGLDEHGSKEVKIYPNPTKGIFRIVPDGGSKVEMEVMVEEMNGKTILKKICKGQEEYLIDLSSAAEGTYSIMIRSAGWMVNQKLVIIR